EALRFGPVDARERRGRADRDMRERPVASQHPAQGARESLGPFERVVELPFLAIELDAEFAADRSQESRSVLTFEDLEHDDTEAWREHHEMRVSPLGVEQRLAPTGGVVLDRNAERPRHPPNCL